MTELCTCCSNCLNNLAKAICYLPLLCNNRIQQEDPQRAAIWILQVLGAQREGAGAAADAQQVSSQQCQLVLVHSVEFIVQLRECCVQSQSSRAVYILSLAMLWTCNEAVMHVSSGIYMVRHICDDQQLAAAEHTILT